MRPNILFIVIDSFSANKCFGANKTSITPNIDFLISRGIYFSQTISAASSTVLSFGSIFTGLYPFESVTRENNYFKINPKIYKSIMEEQGEYDHHLHDVGLIKWAIKGNVYKVNQLNLIQKEKEFPFLSHLFPILNEFYRPDLQVQTDLNTDGDELYYIDGTEYIGSYHIHPSKGPMEGAIHTPSKHAKLYYKDDLPTPINADLDDEFQVSKKAWKKGGSRMFLNLGSK